VKINILLKSRSGSPRKRKWFSMVNYILENKKTTRKEKVEVETERATRYCAVGMFSGRSRGRVKELGHIYKKDLIPGKGITLQGPTGWRANYHIGEKARGISRKKRGSLGKKRGDEGLIVGCGTRKPSPRWRGGFC